MSSDNWRPGPEVERAFGFDMAFCDDPNCGLHIIARRESGAPICEIVMSRRQTLVTVEICKDNLYDKVTRGDDRE